ncbi:methyltransferase domain-containing protein [Lederbergia sp. NSJ-179]|uniref:class I SAM-dependent methyltransferase n=1 Tax=Lederbergia sp. NSJ-179 TaxID=2931402 RepID=UPI001FD0A69D|nr:methyltransferase domain-containing protein [Lederbergia sp. NSJ-179]MCJ7841055.1 methyltransferase domain-containing protein [Lederbergia sp. NSJ-179]
MEKEKYQSEDIARFAKRVEFLEDPAKRGDISPEELLKILPIKKADHILDLGAGTGYFTIPTAKTVEEGAVFALDIDPNMLEVIRSKAKKENITNIKTLEGSVDDIPLSDNSMDFVLVSLVLHELKPLLSASLREMKRVLKPGGTFVCMEFEAEETPTHPHPRISSSQMEQKVTKAGLKVIQKLFPTDKTYIIIAEKK